MTNQVELTNKTKRYRILSLDGGGIKGTYTASVLSTWETFSGKSIGDYFDLVTGTSTGGIIALALGLRIPLKEVLNLYVKKGPEIFPCSSYGWFGTLYDGVRHLLRPKHSQRVLKASLESVLGNQLLGNSKNRLVIPAFNAVNGEIQLFKTAHIPCFRMDYMLLATSVALATSAAPTYFKAHQDKQAGTFIDGGVWANCPAMVGLIEGVCSLGWPLNQIEVLSLGTTAAPFEISRNRRTGGLFSWNFGLVDLVMTAQVKGTLGMANTLLKNRIHRIDEITRPGRFSLDNSNEIQELKALGEYSARRSFNEVNKVFLEEKADPFQPCHTI